MSKRSSKVAKNTLFLYTRQIIILFVSLFTVRIVFKVLGEADYGLYTVIASIIMMFSTFSGAMASASQRFFSFDLGTNNHIHLKQTFSLTVTIYLFVFIAIFLIMETVGLYYVINHLVMPDTRKIAAVFIYETTIISFGFSLIETPFLALIIAYEDMNIYALLSIIEAILKLIIVLFLQRITYDKLMCYGLLLAVSSGIIALLYIIYCRKKYEESKYKFFWNTSLFRDILSFTGWNMFGASVSTFKMQAVNIVLNQTYSNSIVASRGIASQVNSAVVSFSQSFGTALRPVIIKEYANSDYDRVNKIVGTASKITFLLMYIFILPLCFEMRYVLTLWLGKLPECVVTFSILTLLDALFDSISYPLMTYAQATGKIKIYQLVVGGIQLLNFPLSVLVAEMKLPAYMVSVVAIILTMLAFGARMYLLTRISSFKTIAFIKSNLIPVIIMMVASIWFNIFIINNIETGFLRLILTVLTSTIVIVILSWFILFNEEEKIFILYLIKRRR